MRNGSLDKADILDDVKNFACTGLPEIDLITAGFPCVGFSTVGDMKGLENDQSALFFETMKIVDAVRPRLLFFENVTQIMTSNDGKDIDMILRSISHRGYDARWTVCSAQDVGRPQLRKRWFCLCTRRGAVHPTLKAATPSMSRPMPTLVVSAVPSDSRRFSMLGNAVVPDAALLAFARLYSGFKIQTFEDMSRAKTLQFGAVTGNMSSVVKSHGAFIGDKMSAIQITSPIHKTQKIHLDPTHYLTKQQYTPASHRVALPGLTDEVVLACWPTPRVQAATHSHRLTKRTRKDLPTVAMYASKVNSRTLPKTRDGQGINPRFVEWLMGFPADWTKY